MDVSKINVNAPDEVRINPTLNSDAHKKSISPNGTTSGRSLKTASSAGQRRLRTEANPHALMMALGFQADLKAKPTPEEIADILIKYHGNPDQALLGAAQNGDLIAVKKLLAYGANKNGTIGWGNISYSLLDVACLSTNIDLVKYLTETERLKISNNTFLAALLNKDDNGFKVIEYFISRGASLPEEILPIYLSNTQNSSVTVHDNDVVQFLTKLGAKYNPKKSPSNISMWISEWLFLNLYSRSYGKNESARQIIKTLLPLGLEHNLRNDLFLAESNGVFYSTPLLCAILNDDIEMVRDLIAFGANVKCNGFERRSQYGKGVEISPLQLAINLGRKEILALLLSNEAKLSG